MSGSQDRQQNLEPALSASPAAGTSKRKTLTQEVVRELLDYDPDTGTLRWKRFRGSRAKAGEGAGTLHRKSGYIYVTVLQRRCRAHRLIWLWAYGHFPEHDIDHIDRNRANNRLSNLREVTRTCNARNSSLRCDSKTGVTGVTWISERRKWQVHVYLASKGKTLGYFRVFDDAVKARHQAEVEYGWPGCNSSTPAYLYLKEKGLLPCQKD